MPVRGAAHCQTSWDKVLRWGRFTRLSALSADRQAQAGLVHEAEFRGEKKLSSCVVVAEEPSPACRQTGLEQDEIPCSLGNEGRTKSAGVARPNLVRKRRFQVMWSSRRKRVFEQDEIPCSLGNKGRTKSAGVARPNLIGKEDFKLCDRRGRNKFLNKMEFRVLWETKATRKVLVSCRSLARGAEAASNPVSRSNNGLHPTRLSPPKIGGLTRFQSVL